MITQNFVAIDFETMTPARTSACAVGIVVVMNGVISTKFYSLIKPISDNYEHTNTFIHGITPEMVENSPTFEMLFPVLQKLINGLPIVCHNRNMDINIIKDCMAYYNLTGIDIDNNICTYELTNLSLTACCAQYGINMGIHHDALEDAVACAKILLAYNGKIVSSIGGYDKRQAVRDRTKKSYEHSTLNPLDDEQVLDKSTPFYHASVVITGTFEAYPNRNELGIKLKNLGADINTAISGKTNLVVMGNGAGPSKVKKIEDYRLKGHNIRIIYEPEPLVSH